MDWITWPLAVIGYLVIAIISIGFWLKVGDGTIDGKGAFFAGIFWPISFCIVGLIWLVIKIFCFLFDFGEKFGELSNK